jgi:hypothetical protein
MHRSSLFIPFYWIATFNIIFSTTTTTILVVRLFRPSTAFIATPNTSSSSCSRAASSLLQKMSSSSTETFIGTVSKKVTEALGRTVELVSTSGGGYSGGGGASTSALLDKATNTKYFLKSARGGLDMLRAEYEGIKAYVFFFLVCSLGQVFF